MKQGLWGLSIILIGIGLGITALQWRGAQASTPSPPPPQMIAQDGGQSTAAPVQLPSATSTPTDLPPTPTRTPTSQGPAYLEALNPNMNVRSGPGTDFDRLGLIQPGEQYFIIGRLYSWYQIEFPNSPSRTAWAYGEIVTVYGDVNQIPDLSQEDVPTIDPNVAAAAETQIAATQTPGGLLTLTAQAENAAPNDSALITVSPEPSTTLAPGERLPTFTFVPITPTNIPLEQLQRRPNTASDNANEPFAPAIPVLGLIGLGVVGTLVGIFRRL